jgi:hypothetical protein
MRVPIFLFLILFLSLQTRGQDSPLFIIVNCSEGVMLDGQAISPGEMVYSTSVSFIIPKEGYLGMIGNNGFVMRFQNSFLVKKLVENLQKTKKPKLRATGVMGIGDLVEAEFIGSASLQYGELVGDSILLAIKVNHHAKPPYFIRFLNLFEDLIETDTISGNWRVYNVRKYLNKDSAILFVAKNATNTYNYTPEEYLKSASDNSKRKKLNFDLSRIPKNEIDQLIYKIAIYDFNLYFYDQLFLLYQLERSNYQPQNKILTHYINQLKKQYQFELFDFHK